MEVRSKSSKTLFGESYVAVKTFEPGPRLVQGAYIIGRMMSMCRQSVRGERSISKEDASRVVAREVVADWIEKNVYPMAERSVARKIKQDYERFLDLRRREAKFEKVTAALSEQIQSFNQSMNVRAYDIRCRDQEYQRQQEKLHGVIMTADDEAFYQDNCCGIYVAQTTPTVPLYWLKQKKRVEARSVAESDKIAAAQEEAALQASVDAEEFRRSLVIDSDLSFPRFELEDTDYMDRITSTPIKSDRRDRNADHPPDTNKFPKVGVRSGRKTFNGDLMRFIVHALCKYKVTTGDLLGISVDMANMVFEQNWTKSTSDRDVQGGDEPMECSSDDDDDDDNEPEVNPVDSLKRKRCSVDLTFTLPSRRCLREYVKDASFLSLEKVARKMIDVDRVVTIGLDDTTKAAGHKRFDVKTDHITVANPSSSTVETFTTGYVENLSHSGKDAAEGYRYKLECLAVLADTTVDDVMSHVDFWMSDRAADCATMMKELGVEKSDILKCSAHLILGVDHGIDKVFRMAEERIGIDKLIDCSKILRSNSSSLHTIALIAVTKLLSPSHSSHSVSLFNEFQSWMETHEYTHRFKGFVSNRFGRVADLAKLFLIMEEPIRLFFESVVDSNSNKLVLAVSTFITNDWFKCCAEVYSLIGDIAIFPLMDLLRIDGRGTETPTWETVCNFFEKKLPKLQTLQERFKATTTGKGRLIGAVLEEVVEVLQRQLREMDIFQCSTSDSDFSKLRFAPVTNLGCESNFAKLDNRIRVAGGSTSVDTHSKKNVVATNRVLLDDFGEMDEDEKRRKWKWARNSEAVNKVKELDEQFLARVKLSRQLALNKKEELKRTKIAKLMEVTDLVKSHGGPITPATLAILSRLNEKQLLMEVKYLRMTICPDIRQKRRVRMGGVYRYENFSIDELRRTIKNCVHPEASKLVDVDTMLKLVMQST